MMPTVYSVGRAVVSQWPRNHRAADRVQAGRQASVRPSTTNNRHLCPGTKWSTSLRPSLVHSSSSIAWCAPSIYILRRHAHFMDVISALLLLTRESVRTFLCSLCDKQEDVRTCSHERKTSWNNNTRGVVVKNLNVEETDRGTPWAETQTKECRGGDRICTRSRILADRFFLFDAGSTLVYRHCTRIAAESVVVVG